MKCEHCGKKDATFYYRSTVNGRTTQAHLCQDCARELGYERAMAPAGLLGGSFFRPFALLDDFFGPGLAGRMLTEFPAPGNTVDQKQAPAEETLLSEEERRSLGLQRQRNELEHRLHRAIDSEDYEEAARVRDALQALAKE